jgi:hypothetical protein
VACSNASDQSSVRKQVRIHASPIEALAEVRGVGFGGKGGASFSRQLRCGRCLPLVARRANRWDRWTPRNDALREATMRATHGQAEFARQALEILRAPFVLGEVALMRDGADARNGSESVREWLEYRLGTSPTLAATRKMQSSCGGQ